MRIPLLVVAWLAIAGLAAGQNDPGLLAYIGNAFEVPRTFVDSEDFRVVDSRHFHEVWWSGNGTQGNVTFRILRGGLGGEVVFERVYTAGVEAQNKDAWEPQNGTHRFELRFDQYVGSADGYVWDVELADAGVIVEPPLPQPTGPSVGGAQEPRLAPDIAWLTPSLALQLGGGLITGAIAIGGVLLVRRKQRRLAERLERVERAFEANRTQRERCREELLALRDELRGELGRNKLEERHYLLLEERIEMYLKRLDTV